jgi:predicted histone-like DNA-binding protein
MKYHVIEKINPTNPTAPKKQYASPVKAGNLTLKELSKDIAARTSLTRGDIESVLISFLENMPTYLKIGMSVKLDEFGTLRLSIKSDGVEQGQKFDASKIKGVKIVFTPSSELKRVKL